MARLTERRIRASHPKTKPYKLSDGRGLHLLIKPLPPMGSGSKLWRFRYRHGGRESMVSLGSWPEVSLQRARELLDEERRQVRNNVDPFFVALSSEVYPSGRVNQCNLRSRDRGARRI